MSDARAMHYYIVTERIFNGLEGGFLIKTYFESINLIKERKIQQALLRSLSHTGHYCSFVLVERCLSHFRPANPGKLPFAIHQDNRSSPFCPMAAILSPELDPPVVHFAFIVRLSVSNNTARPVE